MPFNSLEFLAFFPTVLIAYHALPRAFKRPLLLVSSYVFYMWWNAWYGLLLAGVTLVSYAAALAIARRREGARAVLWAGLAGHLGVMFVFKYYGFFAENAERALGRWPGPALEFLLPVGISFYVFQSMSYMVDVYRGQVPAERRLSDYMLYIAFFPQLVAGPIERAGQLLPQLKRDHPLDWERVRGGLLLIAGGLFKKVVLAETLGIFVAAAFGMPEVRGGLSLLIASAMTVYMIYCDIAGYTDIALGCAKALGVDLSPNFRRPFAATNIAQFWQRWHMTVSGWFRDYVFFSLSASPLRRLGVPVLAFVSFFLLGLWHGASWNFVLWGCLNGIFVSAYQLNRDRWARLPAAPAPLRTAFTFLALVSLPSVLTVTDDAAQALRVYKGIFLGGSGLRHWLDLRWLFQGDHAFYLACALFFAGGLEAAQKMQEKGPFFRALRRWPPLPRFGAYAALALAAALAVAVVRKRDYHNTPFFYFQF